MVEKFAEMVNSSAQDMNKIEKYNPFVGKL